MLRRPLLLIAAVLLLSGCTAAAPPDDAPVVTTAEQSATPPMAPSPTAPGYVGLVDPGWADEVSDATGIPRLAVLAYAGAIFRAAEVYPDCGIGWNTLAAIGLTESDHGRHDGSVILDNFVASPPIFGIALDGGNTDEITDTDGGLVDGDAEYDRAVGPMQLIPQTWASWPSDGNGDNIPDPQNIADASIAAAHHMCRASGGMSTEEGWQSGIAAYNTSDEYLVAVATAAQRYYDETR